VYFSAFKLTLFSKLALASQKFGIYFGRISRYASAHADFKLSSFCLHHSSDGHSAQLNIQGSIIMYETYIRLKPNDLHTRLLKRNLHPRVMQQIKDEVAALKEAKRTERIARKKYKALWADFIKPLRYEINNAKVGMRYGREQVPQNGNTEGSPSERITAFAEYIRVMEKLLAMLDAPYKALDHTPIQIARDKGLPNDGEHWTDWIPSRVKDKVSALFAEVPVVPKGKRKTPFQRTMLPDQHEKAKTRLLTKTRKEMETLERQAGIQPTTQRLEKLAQMKRAIKIIEALDKNEAVPATWTKLHMSE